LSLLCIQFFSNENCHYSVNSCHSLAHTENIVIFVHICKRFVHGCHCFVYSFFPIKNCHYSVNSCGFYCHWLNTVSKLSLSCKFSGYALQRISYNWINMCLIVTALYTVFFPIKIVTAWYTVVTPLHILKILLFLKINIRRGNPHSLHILKILLFFFCSHL